MSDAAAGGAATVTHAHLGGRMPELDLDLSSLFRSGPSDRADRPVEILTVCTGNICRSPLAEQVLRTRLASLDVSVASAGTHAQVDQPMTPEAARLAASFDVASAESAAHRARWLTERHLDGTSLVLTMTREHRSHVVGLAPARTRSTFTVREFARLAAAVDDAELRAAVDAAGRDPHARLRAALALLASRRGEVDAPADAADDDVVDPYRRSWNTYLLSAEQLRPGLAQVERVIRAALTT